MATEQLTAVVDSGSEVELLGGRIVTLTEPDKVKVSVEMHSENGAPHKPRVTIEVVRNGEFH